MTAPALDSFEVVEAWLPYMRALLDRGASIPLVVLAFGEYGVHPRATSMEALASVAQLLDLPRQEVLRQLVVACADPERCAELRAQLLTFHRELDAIEGLEREAAVIPPVVQLVRQGRLTAAVRQVPLPVECTTPMPPVDLNALPEPDHVPAKGQKEIEAPWEAFAEPPGSLRWRMGPGEDLMDLWRAFWSTLDSAARQDYLARHAPPAEWRKWLGPGAGDAG